METAEIIKVRNRDNFDKERKERREQTIKRQRHQLGNGPNVGSEKDVVDVATQLTSRGHVDQSELIKLKNALISGEDSIAAFFKVHGALHGLVKELSGNDASRQLLAAGCCCNLALGPGKTCSILARAASTYLITHLTSHNTHLVEICAWTLGNLAASDEKVADLLKSQGLLSKLLALLTRNAEKTILEAAAYSLGHVITSCPNIIEDEQKEEILFRLTVINISGDNGIWLLHILLMDEKLHHVVKHFPMMSFVLTGLSSYVLEEDWDKVLVQINCRIRIAANLWNKEILNEYIVGGYLNEEFVKTVIILLGCQYPDLKKETLWLLGNIYNYVPDSPAKDLFFSSISNSLSVPF